MMNGYLLAENVLHKNNVTEFRSYPNNVSDYTGDGGEEEGRLGRQKRWFPENRGKK